MKTEVKNIENFLMTDKHIIWKLILIVLQEDGQWSLNTDSNVSVKSPWYLNSSICAIIHIM